MALNMTPELRVRREKYLNLGDLYIPPSQSGAPFLSLRFKFQEQYPMMSTIAKEGW
jgi:hypothetical protein